MNQKQRDFLISKIKEQCNARIKDLKEKLPKKPSLNNHLIAGILGHKLQFRTNEEIADAVRKRVELFSAGDTLVFKGETYGERKNFPDGFVAFAPDELFVLPQTYVDALAAYRQENNGNLLLIDQLMRYRDGCEVHITLGTDEVLERFIQAASDLGDMNLLPNIVSNMDNFAKQLKA